MLAGLIAGPVVAVGQTSAPVVAPAEAAVATSTAPALPPAPKLADLPPDNFYGEDVQPCVPIDKDADIVDLNDRFAQARVNIVESNHFIPVVEQLIRGQTAPLPRDIAFVLRNIPNHYRALNAMSRWQATNPIPFEPDMAAPIWTTACYFQRAIDWRPTDYRLRLLYASHLQKLKRFGDARAQYVRVEAMGFESADVYYNRGLLELDAGDLKLAQAYADKAYSMGYPLPGLRNRLQRALAGEPVDGAKSAPRKGAAGAKKPASSTKIPKAPKQAPAAGGTSPSTATSSR